MSDGSKPWTFEVVKGHPISSTPDGLTPIPSSQKLEFGKVYFCKDPFANGIFEATAGGGDQLISDNNIVFVYKTDDGRDCWVYSSMMNRKSLGIAFPNR